MQMVGKIDKEMYAAVGLNIATDEVVITNERVAHIIHRRGADFYQKYSPLFPQVISAPDYIFSDTHEHSVLVCRTFDNGKTAINLVLRLAVEGENPNYKNSIITAIRENQKRFSQRIRNSEVLFKSVDKCG